MEGHADNAAAAVLGGLVVVSPDGDGWLARRIEIAPLALAVVLPQVSLLTHQARAVLPRQVALQDASFNLSRALLVVEALRSGDLTLLNRAMEDRLHLPYRLPLIPGGEAAMRAGYQAGASAVTLSGAGPSLIAFTAGDSTAASSIATAITAAFHTQGVVVRAFTLDASPQGARVEIMSA
jgi:homoserine kinase